MYVWYTVTLSSGVMFDILPEPYPWETHAGAISNSEWMVPGTVDPNED